MSLVHFWERIRQSLWFVPTVLTAVAVVAALVTIEIDRGFTPSSSRVWLLFNVGAEGARALLTGIVQSIITVTGVVFSVTIVALQLASTQFTPRVLRSFLSDRGSQWVLAIFIATFTYTLLVVRTVGTPEPDAGEFVPTISVTICIVLSLVSIGALIYFIDHVAQSIRASTILARVTADARAVIADVFPETLGDPADDREPDRTPPVPSTPPRTVVSREAGYLQHVDEEALFSIAELGSVVIRMEAAMGRFVFPGEPIATVWLENAAAGREDLEAIEEKVRESFVLGPHWTLSQDLERALVELTDIAVRALSPSLNDPTTASECVDRVGELLVMLGTRAEPPLARTGEAGRVRFIARRVTWERAVEIGFEKIRFYAERAPAVMLRLIDVCGRVRLRVAPRRRLVLEEQIRLVVETARTSSLTPHDLSVIERAAERALAPVPDQPPPLSG